MLGSSRGGTQAQRQTPGQEHTRQSTAPPIPHRNGGQNEKLLLPPCRATLIPALITVSQLPTVSKADGAPRIKHTVHNKASAIEVASAATTRGEVHYASPIARPSVAER